MDKLDEMIREALEGEDRAILAQTEELGFFPLIFSQFRGKLGWVAWLLTLVQTTMFLAGLWCAVRFFGTAEVIPALRWGLATTVLWVLATNIKLSMMPQIQADRVIRELKRIEQMLAARR
jgi:hypothetical protein